MIAKRYSSLLVIIVAIMWVGCVHNHSKSFIDESTPIVVGQFIVADLAQSISDLTPLDTPLSVLQTNRFDGDLEQALRERGFRVSSDGVNPVNISIFSLSKVNFVGSVSVGDFSRISKKYKYTADGVIPGAKTIGK